VTVVVAAMAAAAAVVAERTTEFDDRTYPVVKFLMKSLSPIY